LIAGLAESTGLRHSLGKPFHRSPKGRLLPALWAAPEPRAAVIFLHGFGEHTGVYHRYGFALNAAVSMCGPSISSGTA